MFLYGFKVKTPSGWLQKTLVDFVLSSLFGLLWGFSGVGRPKERNPMKKHKDLEICGVLLLSAVQTSTKKQTKQQLSEEKLYIRLEKTRKNSKPVSKTSLSSLERLTLDSQGRRSQIPLARHHRRPWRAQHQWSAARGC